MPSNNHPCVRQLLTILKTKGCFESWRAESWSREVLSSRPILAICRSTDTACWRVQEDAVEGRLTPTFTRAVSDKTISPLEKSLRATSPSPLPLKGLSSRPKCWRLFKALLPTSPAEDLISPAVQRLFSGLSAAMLEGMLSWLAGFRHDSRAWHHVGTLTSYLQCCWWWATKAPLSPLLTSALLSIVAKWTLLQRLQLNHWHRI